MEQQSTLVRAWCGAEPLPGGMHNQGAGLALLQKLCKLVLYTHHEEKRAAVLSALSEQGSSPSSVVVLPAGLAEPWGQGELLTEIL